MIRRATKTLRYPLIESQYWKTALFPEWGGFFNIFKQRFLFNKNAAFQSDYKCQLNEYDKNRHIDIDIS